MSAAQRKTWMILIVGLVAATAVTWLFLISPKMNARTEAMAQANLNRDNAAAASKSAAELEGKAVQLNTAVAESERLTSMFPEDYDQGDWLNLMYEAAAVAGVNVRGITPSVPGQDTQDAGAAALPNPSATTGTTPAPSAATPSASATPGQAPAAGAAGGGDFPVAVSSVNVDVSGPVRNLVRFIEEVENLSRPILVEQVSISGSGEEATLSLVGSTFLTRPLAAPAGVNLNGE